MIQTLKRVVKENVSPSVYHPLIYWLRYRKAVPMRWGSLRHLRPVGEDFGWNRGQPIDRYYIEMFLSANAHDIKGVTLEFGDTTYSRQFGGNRVTKSDVIFPYEGNPNATIVVDITQADHLPAETFDCIICTQVVQYIYDMEAALKNIYRLLKPGGVLLLTGTGISQISRSDMDRWGDYWRFTSLSARKMLAKHFAENNLSITCYGNVLTAVAFLSGVVSQELKKEELTYHDPNYELVVTVRAVKPETKTSDSF